MYDDKLIQALSRIPDSLERIAPQSSTKSDLNGADAFVWHADRHWLEPINKINRVEIELLKGIDHQQDILWENTKRFAAGLPANNALLWGTRGTGKSSLVKTVNAAVQAKDGHNLALVEIHHEDIPSLPILLSLLRLSRRQSIVFCDDLSFDGDDASYKSLKAVIEGGI